MNFNITFLELLGKHNPSMTTNEWNMLGKKSNKNKKHSENADTFTSVTLNCDLDLELRPKRLM